MRKSAALTALGFVVALALLLFEWVPADVQAKYSGPEEAFASSCSHPRKIGVSFESGFHIELEVVKSGPDFLKLYVNITSNNQRGGFFLSPRTVIVENLDTSEIKVRKVWFDWEFSHKSQETKVFSVNLRFDRSGIVVGEKGFRVTLPSIEQAGARWLPAHIFVYNAPGFLRGRWNGRILYVICK